MTLSDGPFEYRDARTVVSTLGESHAPLHVGFVHVGPKNHGVLRYGQVLAVETARRSDVYVTERALAFRTGLFGLRELLSAAHALRDCDVVHLQYNVQREGCVWGAGWRQLVRLVVFLVACRRPVVCTIHDLYPMVRGSARDLRSRLRALRRTFRITRHCIRVLAIRARQLFVCSQEERRHLSAVISAKRVHVIPHFIEEREIRLPPSGAAARLDLGDVRAVTLLGFIHPRKGHRLAVEALARLPEDYILVFAGGPPRGSSGFVQELRRLADKLGVARRLRITGFLSDADLNLYLSATAVPICPFARVAASGSMATWLSAGRGVLSSEVPLAGEYNAMVDGAIRLFAPQTPGALAEGILRFASERVRADAAATRLRQVLGAPAVAAAHLRHYASLLGRPRLGRRQSSA